MTASPASTVSSDLYATAEPSNQGNCDTLVSEKGGQGQLMPDVSAKGGVPGQVDAVRIPLPESEKPANTDFAATNGIVSGLPHKRKRGSDGSGFGLNTSSSTDVPAKDLDARNVAQHEQGGHSGTQSPDMKRSRTVEDQAIEPSKDIDGPPNAHSLPPALWQHVFCYVPPVYLGRLLHVSRKFNQYLTLSNVKADPSQSHNGILRPLSAEAIWTASRRLFCPGLPKPLKGKTELHMWRLLRGRNCQECGVVRKASSTSDPGNPWESGPGPDHVRVVWPFALRCCGDCLQRVSKKEIDLSLSWECPFFLLQGLPCAFVSEGNLFVGQTVMRNFSIPSGLRVSKQYYIPHLSQIKQEFENAKEFGPASAEEWTKGLAHEGQERLDDTIRWEQWEARGGLKKVNSRPVPRTTAQGAAILENQPVIIKKDPDLDRPNLQAMVNATDFERNSGITIPYTDPSKPAQQLQGHYQPTWNARAPLSGAAQYGQQFPFHQSRPQRNLLDVNEAKTARRAEIERRCATLDPPLHSSLLNHMDSFQAAIQISQPLTDPAWEVLKPRLLAQVPQAERREKEQAEEAEIIEEGHKRRRQLEEHMKQTKDSSDREWETTQAPVRNRIGALADNIIAHRWSGGKNITKEISPKFAADVLLRVRERFYADIAKEDEDSVAAGKPIKRSSSNEPRSRTLILEHMKWVFDNKIRPLTDHFQRELFLCNGCEEKVKFYGFEGVVQHYAAKHTTTLSMGNIVVHWRAEWPEEPPFHPDPSAAKSAYYKVPNPAPPTSGPGHHVYNPFGAAAGGGISHGAPKGHNSKTEYNDQESTKQSLAAPKSHHEDLHQHLEKQTSPQFSAPRQEAATAFTGHQTGYPSNAEMVNADPIHQPVSRLPTYGPSINQYPYPHIQSQPNPGPPSFIPSSSFVTQAPRPQVISTPAYANPTFNNPSQSFNRVSSTPASDLYKRQMDQMAKDAKDVFTSIGGVKDLPGSVRIYVTIQHTVSRFKAAFPSEPSLAMFIDGLDQNPTMRPVRSVNGLACLTCVKSGTSAGLSNQSHGVLIGDRRLYTLPHLVNHFKSSHVEEPQGTGFPPHRLSTSACDWKRDMIELPPISVISNLVHLAGMNDQKLALIAGVFPDAFPSPLPSLRGQGTTGPLPMYQGGLNSSIVPQPQLYFNGQPSGQTLDRPHSSFHPLSQAAASEPPGEDEYDPTNPTFYGKILQKESQQPHKPARASAPHSDLQSFLQGPSQVFLNKSQRGDNNRSAQSNMKSQADLNNSGNIRNYSPTSCVPNPPQQPTIALQSRQEIYQNISSYQANAQRLANTNETQRLTNPTTRHQDIPEYVRMVDDSKAFSPKEAHEETSSQGLDDADRFLSSIAAGPGGVASRKANASSRMGPSGQKQNLPETTLHSRRSMPSEDDGAFGVWSEDRSRSGREDAGRGANQMLTGRSETRSRNGVIMKPETGYERLPEEYDPYRPGSRVQQIIIKSARDNSHAPVGYETYGDSQRSNLQERSSRGESRPQQILRVSKPRDRTRSPEPPAAETGLYRTRSPVEEDRRDSVYQARTSSVRKDTRSERVVNYQYEPQQPRYQYVDASTLEPQYQPRVEYVPVRYEDADPAEPTHYVVSQPVERKLAPQYVHYERSYAPEPVYERNDQVYQTSSRAFQGQPGQAMPPYVAQYRY